MKQPKLFKFFAIITILMTIIFPIMKQDVLAQEDLPTPKETAALPSLNPLPLDETTSNLWVVRVYFENRQQIEEIAAWIEPWEVNQKEGYLVLGVSQAEYNRLLAQGYRLEIDQELTALLNQPLAYLPGQTNGIPGYPCYRTVDETYQAALNIVASHPELAEWIDIGNSWEKNDPSGLPGYDLRVLRLTNEANHIDKPKFFIMSAIHAREYTTAELATRFAEYLISNYNIDPDITWLLDTTEIHLLLQSNPDGRKQAETGLSWRKNTNENYCSPTSTSRGADLNRNFEFQWGCCGGSSGAQCDETYRGPSPASEPETQAIQNYVSSIFPDQRGDNLSDPAPINATGLFLDLHSYSELVLWPWGFTYQAAPNGTALQTLGRKFAYFNDYQPDQSVGLYPTDGTTDDFAYGELGVAAYTFEMGTAFFQSCSTFENTILPENLPALVYAAKVARTPYMTPAGPDALTVTALPNMAAAGDAITLNATINDTRYSNNNGSEPFQNIAAAAYYMDTPPWESGAITNTLSAADGNFNASIENVTATVDTSGLGQGRHTIFVRGQDAAGNWGAVSAVFLYVIDPATAPTLQGYVREVGTNLPLEATVSANGLFQTTTDQLTGFYQMYVISGTYDLTASADQHSSQTIPKIIVADGQVYNQDISLDMMCTAFEDHVETGTNGWTAQNPWAISTESHHSPTHAWSDSPGGNYGNYRNVSLTSPIIDLSGYSDIELNFWQICNTESGYDYCHVEVSNNGGASWTEIGLYDGTHTQWENINLAASSLNNQPDARLRFRFTSDSNTTADGWHLDDIQLNGSGEACLLATLPRAEFRSSSPDPVGTATTFTNLSTGADLQFTWDFGDASPTVTDTNPTHIFPAISYYTVTLTTTNLLGSAVFSDVITIEPPATALSLEKTASVSETSPNQVFTYTLLTQFDLAGTHTYQTQLVDPVPPEVVVLTETIRFGGVPAPQLYDPILRTITAPLQGVFTDTATISLTFQVQVDASAISDAWIENQASAQAWIDGVRVPGTHQATSQVAAPSLPDLTLNKTASLTEALPGEIFTYTLQAQIDLPGTHQYQFHLLDPLPAEVTILTDTLQLMGVPAPQLYDPASESITVTLGGSFTHTIGISLTFQVQVNATAPGGSLIENQVTAQASVDGLHSPEAVHSANVSILPPPELAVEKTLSTSIALQGEVFTYTLQANLALPGERAYTLVLSDILPAEISVMTESLRLNGSPAPEIYDAQTHTLFYTDSGSAQNAHEVTITFQAQTGEQIVPETWIANRLEAQAMVEGYIFALEASAQATIFISKDDHFTIFLPMITQ